MHDMTFIEILKISIVLPILLFLSVVGCAAAIERWIYFMRNGRVNQSMVERVRALLKAGNLSDAKKEALRHPGLIAESIVAQIDAAAMPRSERESLVLYYHQKVQILMQKRLWLFGTLSFICPLIGLWGTVMGVIRSFKDLALSGSGGPTIVAAGISEALIATAGGIAVAIMGALIYNWFNVWMKSTLSTTDLFGQEIIFLTSKGA